MLSSGEKGFTLIEFLISLVIVTCITAVLFVPFTDSKSRAKNEETKTNVHHIMVAIERYQVDQKFYPPFLLGGDAQGWLKWHQKNDEKAPDETKPSNNLVNDVLIQYGYLHSYPKNPFVDDGAEVIAKTSAGGDSPGDGDPRFGYNGDTMGNGLSDPKFYKHGKYGIPAVQTPLIETSRTLSADAVRMHEFLDPPGGVHYMMGGIMNRDYKFRETELYKKNWWPGNFFYRGLFEFPPERKGWSQIDPGVVPAGKRMDHYILGGYGSLDIDGYDVIRLAAFIQQYSDYAYYKLPPPYYKEARASGIRCGYAIEGNNPSSDGSGLPCVAGGGGPYTGPCYPFNRCFDENDEPIRKFIYGAPDGLADGVIVIHVDDDVDNGMLVTIPPMD